VAASPKSGGCDTTIEGGDPRYLFSKPAAIVQRFDANGSMRPDPIIDGRVGPAARPRCSERIREAGGALKDAGAIRGSSTEVSDNDKRGIASRLRDMIAAAGSHFVWRSITRSVSNVSRFSTSSLLRKCGSLPTKDWPPPIGYGLC
jgi:hypothetical protein